MQFKINPKNMKQRWYCDDTYKTDLLNILMIHQTSESFWQISFCFFFNFGIKVWWDISKCTYRRETATDCILTCLCVLGGVATLNKSPWILRTGGAPLLSLGTVTTRCWVELFPPPATKLQKRTQINLHNSQYITAYSGGLDVTHLSRGCQ